MSIEGATPPQAVLFSKGDELRRLIEDPKFVEKTDSTALLIVKAKELLEQAEHASLLPRSEAKDYAYKILRYVVYARLGRVALKQSHSVRRVVQDPSRKMRQSTEELLKKLQM